MGDIGRRVAAAPIAAETSCRIRHRTALISIGIDRLLRLGKERREADTRHVVRNHDQRGGATIELGRSHARVRLVTEASETGGSFAKREVERRDRAEDRAQSQNFEWLTDRPDGVTTLTKAVFEGQLCRLWERDR